MESLSPAIRRSRRNVGDRNPCALFIFETERARHVRSSFEASRVTTHTLSRRLLP